MSTTLGTPATPGHREQHLRSVLGAPQIGRKQHSTPVRDGGAGHHEVVPATATRLIGRDDSLGRLTAPLERAAEGHPAVALVSGETGSAALRWSASW